jgi:hypothetical protein
MQKLEKTRTSAWVYPTHILLLNERGLTLSSFLAYALPMFLDLPPDPREQLIKADMEKMVLRLRSTYEFEIKQIVQGKTEKDAESNREKAKTADLIQFGEYLQRTTAYPVFKSQLMRKYYDDDTILTIVTREINRMNGKTYRENEVWNTAITWYQKYGATS